MLYFGWHEEIVSDFVAVFEFVLQSYMQMISALHNISKVFRNKLTFFKMALLIACN